MAVKPAEQPFEQRAANDRSEPEAVVYPGIMLAFSPTAQRVRNPQTHRKSLRFHALFAATWEGKKTKLRSHKRLAIMLAPLVDE